MFQAVCFDFDYTLGDSTDSIVAGFQHGLTALGWPAPDREAVRNTIGYVLEDAYTLLTGDASPENRARFRPLFLEVAMERQRRETTLFPGAEELLRGLHRRGIKQAIVSSKRGDTIQIILDRLGLLQELDLVIGSADVRRHKPDPEGLLLAMERLGVPRGHPVLRRHRAGRGGGPKCGLSLCGGAERHHPRRRLRPLLPGPHRPGPGRSGPLAGPVSKKIPAVAGATAGIFYI